MGSTTKSCKPIAKKVQAMNGTDAMLTGGYATVSGYSYATPPCNSGACASQDLDKLAAALEETPVSICVNAGAWNDYTGGVMSSAQCGSMAADMQDHCVIATAGQARGVRRDIFTLRWPRIPVDLLMMQPLPRFHWILLQNKRLVQQKILSACTVLRQWAPHSSTLFEHDNLSPISV